MVIITPNWKKPRCPSIPEGINCGTSYNRTLSSNEKGMTYAKT
jgi:hypothetical protein